MDKKKFIGELVTIRYSDRRTPISGLVIDYNDDWTLMKYNPLDFVVDGYIILRHKNISGFEKGAGEILSERIISLKGITVTEADRIPLNSLETILQHISEKFLLFQIELKSEKACYIGKLKFVDDKKVVIKSLHPKGKWGVEMQFRKGDIRVIEYNTDYLNSLKLLLG